MRIAISYCPSAKLAGSGNAWSAVPKGETATVGSRRGPAVAIVQGDARPGSRLAVAHARDPHHALFHTDPRVHREICDLHDRGWPARGPWLSVRGVGPRARNTDRGQRRVAGPGRVIGR